MTCKLIVIIYLYLMCARNVCSVPSGANISSSDESLKKFQTSQPVLVNSSQVTESTNDFETESSLNEELNTNDSAETLLKKLVPESDALLPVTTTETHDVATDTSANSSFVVTESLVEVESTEIPVQVVTISDEARTSFLSSYSTNNLKNLDINVSTFRTPDLTNSSNVKNEIIMEDNVISNFSNIDIPVEITSTVNNDVKIDEGPPRNDKSIQNINKTNLNHFNSNNDYTTELPPQIQTEFIDFSEDIKLSTGTERPLNETTEIAQHNQANMNTFVGVDGSTLENGLLTVRKCCDPLKYFSLVTHACESFENHTYFQFSIFKLVRSKNVTEIQFKASPLNACASTNGAPSILSGITNRTHLISDNGDIIEKLSKHSYDHSEYCLELVGKTAEDVILTLAFCSQIAEAIEEKETANIKDNHEHLVRKCCGETEYYDTNLNKCKTVEGLHTFASYVQELTFENEEVDLKIISSRIHECPSESITPEIIHIDTNAFRILHNGKLIETSTGVYHNYSHYCLEIMGPSSRELTFTLALCSESYVIPKCCPFAQYFDELRLVCLPVPSKYKDLNEIISYFHSDSESYSVIPAIDSLQCTHAFPVHEQADNLFISGGKLCDDMVCFDKDKFCIDFVGHNDKKLEASAIYCQQEYFIKCCKEGHILSEIGCIPYDEGNSLLLEQLKNTRNPINSFNIKSCTKSKGILLDKALSAYVIWWVSIDGSYLTISDHTNKKNVVNYCIDDYKDNKGMIGEGAYVCESEVSHLLPNEHHFLRYSERGSLGKCCPENLAEDYVYYFSSETNNCELMAFNQSLKDDKYLKQGGFTVEHFHDFPNCPSDLVGYHKFKFEPGPYDHAEISSKGLLKIVSKDGKCVQREDLVVDRDYCIEYILSADGELKASAFLCAYATVTKVYREKFAFVTALLGISSVCLFLTLIFLLTTRVRRGFVTVRKVKTLPGRILVSFISSHLIGFVSFSLTQHPNALNTEDTVGCYFLAGLVQFFNLATFCWNTSICLESLLLTINISLSKCVRYLLHSVWAWGFPLLMTCLMFIMDAHRDELPCGIVTSKIGVYNCFHSDDDATLLYFYLPILLTLIANIVFLSVAKAMRTARLRNLEMGGPRVPKNVKTGGQRSAETSNTEGGQQGNSGMRTHQNQNIKTDSLRIVLWTGGTWFMELAGFVLTRYVIPPSRTQQWYDYLWYIPTSINALRGVGIFVITVLTEDNRKVIKHRFTKTQIRMRRLYRTFKESTRTNDSRGLSTKSTRKSSFDDDRKRNMSVTTMISTLSTSFYNSSSFNRSNEDDSMRKMSIGSFLSSKLESLRKTSTDNNNGRKISLNNNKPSRKIGIIRSVSQLDRRVSASNSFIEELEMEEENSKRRCSGPLPKLQEEESCMEREDSEEEYEELKQKIIDNKILEESGDEQENEIYTKTNEISPLNKDITPKHSTISISEKEDGKTTDVQISTEDVINEPSKEVESTKQEETNSNESADETDRLAAHENQSFSLESENLNSLERSSS